jgi:hypothetical protein
LRSLKHKGLSKQSIDTRYKYLGKMLEKHLSVRAADIDRYQTEAFALVCRDTLKPDTAKKRINSSIAKMLSNRYQKSSTKPDELIFTSRAGLPVDNGNVAGRSFVRVGD